MEVGIEQKYKEFKKAKDSSVWTFANTILYEMCDKNPGHKDTNVILGKLLLIGRSYAAALERTKDRPEYRGDSDGFYRKEVAPRMKAIGTELDSRLRSLKKSEKDISDDVESILITHHFLTVAFNEMSGMNKRSLASKYLHFHCPDKFFLFDSRAQAAVKQIVDKPEKNALENLKEYDSEYGDFVLRMAELQKYLKKMTNRDVTPRDLDDFLLYRTEE